MGTRLRAGVPARGRDRPPGAAASTRWSISPATSYLGHVLCGRFVQHLFLTRSPQRSGNNLQRASAVRIGHAVPPRCDRLATPVASARAHRRTTISPPHRRTIGDPASLSRHRGGREAAPECAGDHASRWEPLWRRSRHRRRGGGNDVPLVKAWKWVCNVVSGQPKSGRRRLTVPGLMNGEIEIAPTNQPPAPSNRAGVVGNRWVTREGAIGGADRQLKDWIQGGAG